MAPSLVNNPYLPIILKNCKIGVVRAAGGPNRHRWWRRVYNRYSRLSICIRRSIAVLAGTVRTAPVRGGLGLRLIRPKFTGGGGGHHILMPAASDPRTGVYAQK